MANRPRVTVDGDEAPAASPVIGPVMPNGLPGSVAHAALDREAHALAALRRAEGDVARLKAQLSAAEARPVKLIRAKVVRWFLHMLSRASPPLSARRAARFGRSAAKRAPHRRGLLHDWPEFDYGAALAAWQAQRARAKDEIAARAAALGRDGPTVSILITLHGVRADVLERTLRSVACQSYGRWQVCIAGNVSEEIAARMALDDAGTEPGRVRCSFENRMAGPAALAQRAFDLASGGLVLRLAQDDLLDRDALLELVEPTLKEHGPGIVYGDEDVVRLDGVRAAPNFKPDWNRELLLGTNYVGCPVLIDAGLARRAGGYRAGFDGAEDHDLLLRASASPGGSGVAHVPRVLCTRQLARRDDEAGDEARCRAVADHLAQSGWPAVVKPGPLPGTVRPIFVLPDPAPHVSVVIPTRDRLDLLRVTVERMLERTDYPSYDLTIVDNGSVEPATLEWLRQIAADDRVRVRRDDGPFNYSALNNAAVRETRGELLALVNNDVEVRDGGWLREMASLAVRTDIGCVGAKLLYPDGRVQHAGVIVGINGLTGHWLKLLPGDHPGYLGRLMLRQEMTAVTGACLVVRRSVFEEVGGLDEALPVDFNDVDLCLKVRAAGHANVWTPFAELVHHESATRIGHDTPEKKERFRRDAAHMRRAWGTNDFRDPAYNPNLSRDTEVLDLAAVAEPDRRPTVGPRR